MKLLQAIALMSMTTALAAQAPADTPAKTAAGTAYVQPKDWTVAVREPVTLLTSPEGSLRVAVVQVGAAGDAQAAAAKAWGLYKPGPLRPVRLATVTAPGEGWDERVTVAYETSPNEQAVATALAVRQGAAWTVMITDGSEAVANKRSSATAVVASSIRPAGYKREDFTGKAAHRLTPERVQALRDFVAAAAAKLEVPGIGMALIDGGKVVWQGGVGVRELGKAEPVTAHTKFMVASNTKGMATLLLSVLADEKKLDWDQHVTAVYPEFRLGDDATTRSVLIRHLVCACTGLPRKDYAFILDDPGRPASDTFRQLAATQPTSKFGELFQYNNLMASAAGYVGGHLAYPGMELGAAFDRAMQTRIFDPLGMRDTTFDLAKGESGDWARPHGRDVDGRTVELSNGFNHLIVPHRPAGGAWSSAADMARYAQLELGKGVTPEGKRLVSEANILERRRHGVPIGEDGWYGMGLMEKVEWGVPVVTHGGTLQGYHSDFWILPEAGIGAVMLTNADSGASLFEPFLRRLLEVVYDGRPEAAGQIDAAAARLRATDKARRERLTIPADPQLLTRLATAYRDPEGRTIRFSERDGGRWMKAGFVEGPVATRRNADGSMSVVSAGAGLIPVEAVVGEAGGRRTLTVRDSQHDYVYTEVR